MNARSFVNNNVFILVQSEKHGANLLINFAGLSLCALWLFVLHFFSVCKIHCLSYVSLLFIPSFVFLSYFNSMHSLKKPVHEKTIEFSFMFVFQVFIPSYFPESYSSECFILPSYWEFCLVTLFSSHCFVLVTHSCHSLFL